MSADAVDRWGGRGSSARRRFSEVDASASTTEATSASRVSKRKRPAMKEARATARATGSASSSSSSSTASASKRVQPPQPVFEACAEDRKVSANSDNVAVESLGVEAGFEMPAPLIGKVVTVAMVDDWLTKNTALLNKYYPDEEGVVAQELVLAIDISQTTATILIHGMRMQNVELEYDADLRRLRIVELNSPQHERVAGRLTVTLAALLDPNADSDIWVVEAGSYVYLVPDGAVPPNLPRQDRKKPDASMGLLTALGGQGRVAVEVGWTETVQRLHEDAQLYFRHTDHFECVLVIKLYRLRTNGLRGIFLAWYVRPVGYARDIDVMPVLMASVGTAPLTSYVLGVLETVYGAALVSNLALFDPPTPATLPRRLQIDHHALTRNSHPLPVGTPARDIDWDLGDARHTVLRALRGVA